jgi:hypothetical protein
MCVIGVFLVAYRLTSRVLDNIAITLAGIAALGVAFVHCAPQHATLSQHRLADVHGPRLDRPPVPHRRQGAQHRPRL